MSKLFKRGDGDIWYCKVVGADGVRRMHSTRCTDKRAAEIRRRQLERAAADPDHAAAGATLTQAIQAFLADRAELVRAGRRAPATLEFYTRKVGHVVRVLEGVPDEGTYQPLPLARFGAVDVDRYITARRGEKAGENTISKELVALRGVLRLALRRGLWKGQIEAIMPIAFAPDYKPRTRALSHAELPALLAELSPDKAARVALIVATSACASEAEKVRRDDVTADASRVLLRGTKRPGRWRTVVIVLPWQRALMGFALDHAQGEDNALFLPWGNIRRDLIAACDRAKIPPCSPNDLRRTFSRWLRAEGVPLEVIAPLMGHATTKMVQLVYGVQTPDELAARVRATCTMGAPHAAVEVAEVAEVAEARNAKTHAKAGVFLCPGTESNRRHGDFQSACGALRRAQEPQDSWSRAAWCDAGVSAGGCRPSGGARPASRRRPARRGPRRRAAAASLGRGQLEQGAQHGRKGPRLRGLEPARAARGGGHHHRLVVGEVARQLLRPEETAPAQRLHASRAGDGVRGLGEIEASATTSGCGATASASSSAMPAADAWRGSCSAQASTASRASAPYSVPRVSATAKVFQASGEAIIALNHATASATQRPPTAATASVWSSARRSSSGRRESGSRARWRPWSASISRHEPITAARNAPAVMGSPEPSSLAHRAVSKLRRRGCQRHPPGMLAGWSASSR